MIQAVALTHARRTDICVSGALRRRRTLSCLQKNSFIHQCVFMTGHACRNSPLKDYAAQLDQTNTSLNSTAHVPFLQWCKESEALIDGRLAHFLIIVCGHHHITLVANHLVQMYSFCFASLDALAVFTHMGHRNAFSWNLVIKVHAHSGGEDHTALQDFNQMLQEGALPTVVTYVTMLDSFTSEVELPAAQSMHARIADFEDVIVGTALVNMYGNCNNPTQASKVFQKMPVRNVISWTAMISVYGQQGHGEEALDLYRQMQQEGMLPNNITAVNVLTTCALHAALRTGKQLHACLQGSDWKEDVIVESSLITMYGKCDCLDYAEVVFERMPMRNVVAWSTMIMVYAQHGQPRHAFCLFDQMQQENIVPNETTFASILAACSNPATIEHGKWLHHFIQTRGLESDVFIGTSLLSMYSKCGSLIDSQSLFNKLPKWDVVVWNAMIVACAEHGRLRIILELFNQMQMQIVKPNRATFLGILGACASQAALSEGVQMHNFILGAKVESDVVIGNALVNMYGQCASMDDAQRVFDRMPERTVVSWSSLITVYALQGIGPEAVRLITRMQSSGLQPEKVTLINVLMACSHAGLVNEAYASFAFMLECLEILPMVADHFVCLVDIIGKAGRLDEAEVFLNTMPYQPPAAAFMTFLSACRLHANNYDYGQWAASSILELNSADAASCFCLANNFDTW